ncbi:hypothetical protein Gpo141_00007205 [Globisporangium polare]
MPLRARFNDDDDNSKKGSMTPLEDREKCMPPCKRRRRHHQQLTTCSTCCYTISRLKRASPNDVTVDDAALFEVNSSGEGDDDDDDLDAQERAQLTEEVTTLRDAVGRMQSQVSAASEKLVELRALVKTLVALRASTKQHQELKKRRAAGP